MKKRTGLDEEDRKWIWSLINYAVMTIVVACEGDGMYVRNSTKEKEEEFLKNTEKHRIDM